MTGQSDTSGWNQRIASIWTALFETHALDRAGTIVEVGPGFANKVGLGLSQYGFEGSLFVVEPNDDARAWVLNQYRQLLPGVEVVPVATAIGSALSLVPGGVDALLMNHVLDDLVLYDTLSVELRMPLFGRMRPGAPCAVEVRQAWEALRNDPAAFDSIGCRVVDEVLALCSATSPLLIAASQYSSWFQIHHGLEFVDRMTAPLLLRLADRLAAAARELRVEVLNQGEPDPRWLVACR